jgi:DNA ligase-1
MHAKTHKTFPTLFKKSETDAIVQWDIRVENCERPIGIQVPVIVTTWGQRGGALQETRDVITHGKNVGRANATTPFEQAVSEAQSKWEKQQKNKKYVQNLDAAQAGEREAEFVTGGVDPMLAFPIEKKPKAVKYPADAQPKLDGHRCIATIKYGKATLWSRTRKPINSMPHIVAALEKAFPVGEVTLDGELYNHDYHEKFEELTSLIRQAVPAPGHEVVQYHIYDVIIEGRSWSTRRTFLEKFLATAKHPLVLVKTVGVQDEEEMQATFQGFLEAGYEGLMLRNQGGVYEQKRSANLLKVKEMLDAEFLCVGVEEGRGKLAGHAIFVFETKKGGPRFNAKMVGDQSVLKRFWDFPEQAIGKLVTVKYQNLSADGIPRFPVALRFREDA